MIRHDIDPVAFSLGPVQVHWYGLMYLIAFAGVWWLGRRRTVDAWRGMSRPEFEDLMFFGILGVLVGGRLGYVVFYDLSRFASDPLSIAQVWNGGMSFHGGLIGVLVAMAWFARSRGKPFFQVADFVAPLVPIGLFTGRIGNYINGGLFGRETDLPWATVFTRTDPRLLPRHPSQLYEAFLEGIVLFALLWWLSSKPRPAMLVSGAFLFGYGVFRSTVEFVRLPDGHIGYLNADEWLTMGHYLTAPMIIAGAILLVLASRRPAVPAGAS